MILYIRKKNLFAGFIAGFIIILDQLSKYWVKSNLQVNIDFISINRYLNFVHRKNPGIAFSLFANAKYAPVVFAIISLAAIIFIIRIIYKNKNLPLIILAAFTAVAAGAAGNLIDRIIPPHKVVDFIDFHIGAWHWPAFNIADSSVCIGATLLIISCFFYKDAF